MGKAARLKGNAFERKVAKLILKAFGPPFKAKDAYRTPMSGGHKFAGASDLIISNRLRKVFSFVVECKHQRNFKVAQLFKSLANMRSFVTQVCEAAKRDRYKRCPLLVVSGNNTPILVAVPVSGSEVIAALMLKLRHQPRFVFWRKKEEWRVFLFTTFLKAVAEDHCREHSLREHEISGKKR